MHSERIRGRHFILSWHLLIAALVHTVAAGSLAAQAPLAGGLVGKWVEVDAFAQSVSNGYGDWSGAYARLVLPSAMDTWYADVLSLRAFDKQGIQTGVAHRHDWNGKVFHVLGANIGSGTPILPRFRADGSLGVRLGSRSEWQLTAGGSYVKSVTELHDIAATGSVAWFAPRALMLEAGMRYNWSRPGDVQSIRLSGVAILTPSPKRSFSLRSIGGSEGWQILSNTTTLTRFHSNETSVAWREKVSDNWAVSLQGDLYTNPFYTRSGVTIGVARYW